VKQLSTSPIDNTPLSTHISCKDYTVSKESFSIVRDENSELLVTSPRPDDDDLGAYYESEDYISHSDSKKSVFDRIYQLVRNYTLRKKIKLINSFHISNKTILDLGAGTGDFLLACQKNGWEVEGVEPSDKARDVAEEKLNQKFKKEVSEISNRKYDVITMWHVLEHVPNLNEYVIQLKGLLKENGRLIVAVPNHKSFDAEYYGTFWAAYDVPRHLWHFSQSAIAQLFLKENLEVLKILPMKFDAFYVSLLSEKYRNGRMNPFKSFYIGMRSNLKAKRTKEYSSLIYIIKNQ